MTTSPDSQKFHKKVFHHIHRHGKTVAKHMQKHHKKYLFGLIGGAALTKTILSLLAGLGIYGLKIPTFADMDYIFFEPVYNAELNTTYESNTGTIAGIQTGIINIEGGEYKINTGEWTTNSGNIFSGDVLQVRNISSENYSETSYTTLTINSETSEFTITTMEDPRPKAIRETMTGLELNTEYFSHTGISSDFDSGLNISVENAEYRLNTGEWTDSTGIVYSGDILQMKMTSNNEYSSTKTGILYLGELLNYFILTTQDFTANTTPENIDFEAITGAELNTLYQSSIEAILGINTGTEISVQNGKYRINGGDWTDTTGIILPNEAVQLQLTSANSYDTVSLADLQIGDMSTYFSVTTLANSGEINTGTTDYNTGENTTETVNYTTGDSSTETNSGTTYPSPEILSGTLEVFGPYTGLVGIGDSFILNLTANTELTGITTNFLNTNYTNSGLNYTINGSLNENDSEGNLDFTINFENLSNVTGIYNLTSSIVFDKTNPTISGLNFSGTITGLNTSFESDELIQYSINFYSGETIILSGENNIFATGFTNISSGFATGTDYIYEIITKDIVNNETTLTGTISFNKNGILQEKAKQVQTTSTLGVFKQEVDKFNACKNNLDFDSTDIEINNFTVNLTFPEFESDYYKKLVNLLTLLIVNTLEEENLGENETNIIMKRYQNFLIVLKLLKDSEEECNQNLSNYHVTQLQYALEKYGIIVEAP